MADEKAHAFEETKWWIDRGPVKEREKPAEPAKGIIEKWAYELLRNYNQDQAAKNASGAIFRWMWVSIRLRSLRELKAGFPFLSAPAAS
ncbi:MAG: hypothetical protein HYY82_18595 [Deltaproteobacteria bacterium]|nr:hypothetical protein [Deltaproteobacteria bacterium]